MSLKLVLLFVTVLVNSEISQATEDHGFIVVSTTQRPSDPIVTTILINQLELSTQLNRELKQQLDQVQKILEEQQKRNEELIQKSLEKDQQISEIKKTLEALQKSFEELTHNQNLENDRKITNQSLPKNCKEVMTRGNNGSGTYLIQSKSEVFTVFCDMETKGGGWTVFQKRVDGSQEFYLGWEDYKKGFGNLSGEFWLGLEHLHQLTGDGKNELLVILVDSKHTEAYANYESFGVGSEEEGFSLKFLSGYVGTAGEGLNYHRGQKFTTKDRDQDANSHNCAVTYESGWWFNNCFHSNLNAKFLSGRGIEWDYSYISDRHNLLASKMMVRPI